MTISLGQMPLKALASYLSVVEGFTKTEDRAIDTKYPKLQQMKMENL